MTGSRMARGERLALVALAACALFVHFFRLGWGLPEWRRSLEVFGSKEEIERLSPRLVRLREEVYSQYRDVNLDTMKGQPKSGEAIGEETLLNGMRSQLLQPRSTDEQQVLGALSRIKQGARELRLPFVVYGYFYLLLVGIFLAAGHALGALRLTSDIAHYFLHPEHIGGLYVLARAVGAASAVGTTLVLFATARRWFGWRTGLVCGLLYCLNPIAVINSHLVKPWGVTAMFEALLAMYCLRVAEGTEIRRDALFAGIFAGLAGATSYLYALTWLWIPVALAGARGRRLSRDDASLLLKSALAGAAVFLATNPQVILNLKDILRLRQQYGFGETKSGYLFPCLTDNFLTLPGALLLAAAAGSLPLAIRGPGPERFAWLVLLPSVLFFGVWIGGSAHHLLPLYPLLILLSARGIAALRSGRLAPVTALLLAANVVSAAGASAAWLRDAGVDRLDEAGRWMREHAPPGSSIASTHAVPGASFPPFAYLRYRWVYLAADDPSASPEQDYVVNATFPTPAFARSSTFQSRYSLVLDGKDGKTSYGSLPVPSRMFTPYASRPVQIWAKR